MSADSATKPDASFVSRSFSTWNNVASRIPRVAALSMVGPALLVVLCYVLWINYGASSLDRSLYGLRANNITLSPVPPWVHTNITEDVYAGSNLSAISLLDREASSNIANAYEGHPWIARVLRVTKMAGSQVKVDVQYRRPLAWVHCERRVTAVRFETEFTAANSTPAADVVDEFYLVDDTGVNLPQKGFQWDDVFNYFQIYCPDVTEPTGPLGSIYNDPRILKALRVCNVLEPLRKELKIERVNVRPERADTASTHWVFELQFKGGKTQAWGHAPGEEVAGEAKVAAKIEQLRQIDAVVSNASP